MLAVSWRDTKYSIGEMKTVKAQADRTMCSCSKVAFRLKKAYSILRNETKRNETKRNETKRNETRRDMTKLKG